MFTHGYTYESMADSSATWLNVHTCQTQVRALPRQVCQRKDRPTQARGSLGSKIERGGETTFHKDKMTLRQYHDYCECSVHSRRHLIISQRQANSSRLEMNAGYSTATNETFMYMNANPEQHSPKFDFHRVECSTTPRTERRLQ